MSDVRTMHAHWTDTPYSNEADNEIVKKHQCRASGYPAYDDDPALSLEFWRTKCTAKEFWDRFGGWGNPKKEAIRSVAAYNPRTGLWRSLPALAIPTAAAGAATIRTINGVTRLFVIGGLASPTAVQEY